MKITEIITDPRVHRAALAEGSGVAEGFTDDLDNIYAIHPQPEKSEKIAFLILDKDEIEFVKDWRELPDPYQQEFGYDLPLVDADDLSEYPNLAVKRITFDQYVQLVGNYIKSEELAGSAMSKMKRGVAESKSSDWDIDLRDLEDEKLSDTDFEVRHGFSRNESRDPFFFYAQDWYLFYSDPSARAKTEAELEKLGYGIRYLKNRDQVEIKKYGDGPLERRIYPVNRLRGNQHTIQEAPLTDYVPKNLDRPAPRWPEPDRKLVTHPVTLQKATKFFERTPYKFRLFFSGQPGLRGHKERGEVGTEEIKRIFGSQAAEINDGRRDAITVVFVGNYGDRRVPLTPWVMAHRIGHAIQSGGRFQQSANTAEREAQNPWYAAEQHFFRGINRILADLYGVQPSRDNYQSWRDEGPNAFKWGLRPQYAALFNALGTQRSSREGEIRRPYEFFYEMFAQYIQTGRVSLNPLPVSVSYGPRAWGRPTRYLSLRSQYRDNDYARQLASEKLGESMTQYFDRILDSAVGRIYLM